MRVDIQFSETVRSFLAPVVPYLDDAEITEIMINSPDEIWVERKGRVERTDARFDSTDALMSAVNNISQFVKRRLSDETPHMDARLPDGSRIHVILPPCARKGICVCIRKFSKDALTVAKLIEFGSLNQKALDFLTACVQMKKNIIVSGGTGSGKTSLLNAISSLIPNHERIIVIEDSAELQLQQEHILSLESKLADRHGKGEVSIRDLLKSTLRLRPDRIIVGEIRGGEALDLLQAMNTGHGGSMGTIHANSPFDTLSRLETLTLFSGVELPLKAIRVQVASAINIIIQTSRYHDGSRKVSHVSEVLPLDDEGNYRVADLFHYEKKGLNQQGRIAGSLVPTGKEPSFFEEIRLSGFALSKDIFAAED
jgi:pilus assembly protein CpaF